ncbi:MAG: hypothetical protein CMJ46_01210 [Planctomyces sp.]|nr:hypothetical protein [Planctomyces sp.]
MTKVRFLLTALAIAAWVSTSTGCSLLHNLQPHRLHRMNRQSPPSSSAMFSVEDKTESVNPIEEFMSSSSVVNVE